ncbi:MAG: hypothetical protein ACM3PU_02435 [Gemmatimonadota bacterium]
MVDAGKLRTHVARGLGALASALSLAGCATPSSLAPGTPETEVIRHFGRPAEVYPLPAPPQARRLAYRIGAFQQQTWMVDVDAQGRVLRVRQVISAEHFAQIRVGKDDQTVIRREFGPPRVEETFARLGLTSWSYPYLEDGFRYSEMSIYFDRSGIVQRVENGPDPRFLGGHDNDVPL